MRIIFILVFLFFCVFETMATDFIDNSLSKSAVTENFNLLDHPAVKNSLLGVAMCQMTTCSATGQLCDDGDCCTVGGVCNNMGQCLSSPINCDDGNICTNDTCDAATGCLHTAVANGTSCGTGLTCEQAACVFIIYKNGFE